MITRWAVKWLTWQLRKDDSFWMAYQANIAMAIQDNIEKYFPLQTNQPGSPTLNEFCNICANDFMNLWTKR